MPPADLPDRIGPYRVADRLGEGGMGTVYVGLDETGRKVAIKVIRREYAADRQYRARFQAEVAAAQRVRPFCTAPVLDADPAADPPYLVTEFVNGPSLDDSVAKDGPLRGADLEAVAVGIATALTAIHDAGVVHRDLKPANVLLSTFGPRVIDFGIARSVDGTRLTATGGIVGTPAFMAPEQLDGRGATPASDVFAWGATVAFAARGGPCFGGDSLPAIIHQIVSGEPDLSGLHGTLLGAVEAALAKDPARRPSAQALLDRLISGGAPRQAPAGAPPAGLSKTGMSRTGMSPAGAPRHAATESGPPPARHGGLSAAPPPGQALTQPPPHAATPPPAHAPTPPPAPAPSPALAAGEADALVERQYRQAAQAGDPSAMRNLAVLLSMQGRTAEAESWQKYADAVAARPAPYPQGTAPGAYGPPTQAPAAGPRPNPYAKPSYNHASIYALTCGLVGLISCGLTSIPAIVAGHIAWARVRRSGQRGLGFAITGISLGWLMVAFWLLVLLGWSLPDDTSSG
ncbi:protein kinase domain-containing protein [Actinomadura montaniterrae]|uniref:Protein kinase n=1 Tax=Actinomadura montaniterrae TaxID=1803903 RepID=A0A6L3VP46_9ACTN|nr:protein kinase [Actinomadura montaniterrae]KAB2376874.1 protein kinase [Actinomadura montaniterrae]